MVVTPFVLAAAMNISFSGVDHHRHHAPLSPLTLGFGAAGVLALARKFFVTDTALNVVGFLTELERA